MEYSQAVAHLYELGQELAKLSSARFDLQQMRVLLRALGDPQQRFRSVLIAGTNGKGSTASTLAAILQAAGYRTGLYTSPHLLKVNERIRINGEDIGDDDFSRMYERVEAACAPLVASDELRHHPSFFEMLTAMAFCWFAESKVEITVLEVGMGGRLDATNVVDPVLSIITDISLDHQKFLGNTIAEIAREKAGILRPGGTVITLPQHPEANEVIGKQALEIGAKLITPVQFMRAPAGSEARDCYTVEVRGEPVRVESPLVGRHQQRNLALAIGAAEELDRIGITIAQRHIERGIRETRWPGRFQVIRGLPGRPDVVLDIAHNPAGAWALRAAISERYGERPVTLVFGVLRDKAVAEIASILFPIAKHVVLTHANNPRAASPEEIRAVGQAFLAPGTAIVCEPAVDAAVASAMTSAEPEGVIVVTGSIYVVGEALAALSRPRAGVIDPEKTKSSIEDQYA
jgi:dihydrofolate synthase/folylpolyglutamate synthase